ncbi:MAG: hypothetical protein QXQ53_01760 [Candidatus Methanosuratincola sp.]
MKEPRIGRAETRMTHHQLAGVPQPGEGALHNPPLPVAPQSPPVLVSGSTVVASDDRFHPLLLEPPAQEITVEGPIGNHPVGALAGPRRLAHPSYRDSVERLLQERTLRWGSQVQVCSQRSTRAIDQNQLLHALALLGLAHLGFPFLAGAKPPSAKHSSQWIFGWSLSWAKNVRHSSRSRPDASHSRRRRQQGLPYRRGSSLQGAPVQRGCPQGTCGHRLRVGPLWGGA